MMADQYRMKAKILMVVDEVETWTSKDGSFSGVNVKVVLDTGASAWVGTKEQYVQSHKDALEKLVGQEVELEVEDRGQFGFKITDYPGKPGGGGSGGSGSKVNPIVYQSQNALLAAAFSCGPGVDPSEVIEIAESFYIPWLKKMAGSSSTAGAAQTTAPPSSDPVVDRAPDGSSSAVPTASLREIRALRALAEQLRLTEAEACEKAGVAYLGEITAEAAPRLLADWSAELGDREGAA